MKDFSVCTNDVTRIRKETISTRNRQYQLLCKNGLACTDTDLSLCARHCNMYIFQLNKHVGLHYNQLLPTNCWWGFFNLSNSGIKWSTEAKKLYVIYRRPANMPDKPISAVFYRQYLDYGLFDCLEISTIIFDHL
jgi:hypothetical protein